MSHRLSLADGSSIPQIGFGTWQVPDDPVPIRAALDAGYRLVDTAPAYGNEGSVGAAVRESGYPRAEIQVATKLNNPDHGFDATIRAFDRSLQLLGLEHIDLYLIHWPKPGVGLYAQSWRAMVQLQREGRVRSIGVSNFAIEHIERIADETGVLPALNQVELHPRFQQRPLRSFARAHGIAVQAWSPLGRGRLDDDAVIGDIARRCGRSVAQVVLRWHVQSSIAIIPRSMSRAHLEENLDIFGFSLTNDEMARIDALDDPSGRIGHDPLVF